MKIRKISKQGLRKIISLEEFQSEIKDKFVFLKLTKKSRVRMESNPTMIDMLEEGFELSTSECSYRKV